MYLRLLFYLLTYILTNTLFSQDRNNQKDYIGRIDTAFLRSVVNIETSKSTGTGFIVMRDSSYYLITNKHVVGNFNFGVEQKYTDSIKVHFYNKNADSSLVQTIKLKDNYGRFFKHFKPHSNPKVDIVAIKLDEIYESNTKIGKYYISIKQLMPLDSISTTTGLGFGSQVFAIGYPNNFKFETTNFPIAKSGFIASALSGKLEILLKIAKDIPLIKFKEKFFMVDGLIIQGNSGGPIISPKDFRFIISPQMTFNYMEYPSDNAVIGIVSFGWDGTGLNVIYSCDYIIELLDF